MKEYIKYFYDEEKNMSFKTEENDMFSKYKEIWSKIKKALSIKFHGQPIYDEKYIKSKVKTFNGVINIVLGLSYLIR